jgi:hypothetical protein
MVFDLLVHIDVVGVQDARVVERLQDGGFESTGEEGVFVGGLVSADQGVEGFALVQKPIEETEVAVGDGEGGGDVNGGIERELNTLDQVEGYGVFETAEGEGC